MEGCLQPFQMRGSEGGPTWGVSGFATSRITPWKRFRNKGSQVAKLFTCLKSIAVSLVVPRIASFLGVCTCCSKHSHCFLRMKNAVPWPILRQRADVWRRSVIWAWTFPWAGWMSTTERSIIWCPLEIVFFNKSFIIYLEWRQRMYKRSRRRRFSGGGPHFLPCG